MGRIAIIDRDLVRNRGSGSGSAKDRVTNGGSGSGSPIHKKRIDPSLNIRSSIIIIFIYKNINKIVVLYYYIYMILY